MKVDEGEIEELLRRIRYWQDYSSKADDHIEQLAAQVEHLHSEINHLLIEVDHLRKKLNSCNV